MGIRHPHSSVFSKDLLCVVLVLACGCSLFKKKDDDVTGGAPGTSTAAVAQPPVFNVNAPASTIGTGGTTTTADPAHHHVVSRAGASGKVAAGGAAAIAASAAAPAAATPSVAVTTPALPTVSQACITACTGTFSTCVQGGQLPACQQALKDCMAICNKKP